LGGHFCTRDEVNAKAPQVRDEANSAALRRLIESKSSRIHKPVFDEAMAAIAEAISLTAERNDAAHGWLEIADGHFRFFQPLTDRPKLVHGTRDVDWLTGVAKRIREATTRCNAVMEVIAKLHVF
jgi:hypothetical protein